MREIQEGTAKAGFHSEPLGRWFKRGQIVRAPREYLEHLVAIGVIHAETVKPVNNKPVGPGQKKPAGPQETKRGPEPKKSSGAPAALPSSSAPGRIGLSSFSAAGLRSLSAMA